MARKKLFYTKNQITENLYTAGTEYQLADGTPYVGLYHRYVTGEVYTEPVWNVKSSKLLQPIKIEPASVKIYRENKKDIKTSFLTPTRYFPEITAADIQQKYITRYFLYKINDKQVIEIDAMQYQQLGSGKLDNNIYSGIRAVWYVAGDTNTVTNGNVTTPGVIQRNQTTINLINRRYPGFRDTVNNPLELYVDTTIIIPPAIN